MIKDLQVIDNYYQDPNDIINKFEQHCINEHWCPGLRSILLQDIDIDFYNKFRSDIFKLHNLEDSPKYTLWTYLNRHQYDASKPECLNYAWPHVDGNAREDKTLNYITYESKMIIGGFIYLTKHPDPETGISFFKEKQEMTKKDLYDIVLHNYLTAKEEYESGKITVDELNQKYTEYYDKFYVDMVVKNRFNRLVTWKCGNIRGTKIISEQQPVKLIHSFYITYA